MDLLNIYEDELNINKTFALLSFFVAQITFGSSNPWSRLAFADLEEIKRLVSENHPGPLDKHNEWFNQWLEQGYEEAQDLAGKADTYQGYFFSLKFFVNGFKDGHLGYWSDLTVDRVKWPGFVIAKRGEHYIVHHISNNQVFKNLPPKGWLLSSCDGKSAAQLMKQNIFPYDGNKDLESHWIGKAPKLFVDVGNPFISKIRKCTFTNFHKTKKKYLDISWKHTNFRDISTYVENAGFGPIPKEFVQRQFGKGNYWISIPSFSPNESDSLQLERIIHGLENLRSANLIVFDVRGNGGGNSQWAHNIVRSLYGEEYQSYRESLLPDQSYVDWRASPGNLSYLQAIVGNFRKTFGVESEVYQVFQAVAEKMANNKASTLLRQPELDDNVTTSEETVKIQSLVKAKVFFLTDGHCGSACLDFADALLKMEGVVHIGLPTSADTLYMDIRQEKLPSSIGNIAFAMKVYRRRLRESNQAYTPKKLWEADIWNTIQLENWIMNLTQMSDL